MIIRTRSFINAALRLGELLRVGPPATSSAPFRTPRSAARTSWRSPIRRGEAAAGCDPPGADEEGAPVESAAHQEM
jgi:hypothetical protein